MRIHFDRSIVSPLLLLVLSLSVLFGWTAHVSALIQLTPRLGGMVVSVAVCFLLLALSLLLPATRLPNQARATAVIAWLILLASGLMLAENLLQRNLGLDFPWLHAWLPDSNPHPGRAAPGTALGLFLCGLVLMLIPRVQRRPVAILVQVLVFSVYAVASMGLAWQLTDIRSALEWFGVPRMPIMAALALLVSATALWEACKRAPWYQDRRLLPDADRLTLVAVSILVVVALSAGIAGIASQQRLLENELNDRFSRILQNRADWFRAEVQLSLQQAQRLASLPAVRSMLAEGGSGRGQGPGSEDFLTALSMQDFRSAQLRTNDGKVVASFGDTTRPREFFPLVGFPGVELVWHEGAHLISEVPIHQGSRIIGWLALQKAFPLFEQILSLRGGGTGWEMRVCLPERDQLRCPPSLASTRSGAPRASESFWSEAAKLLKDRTDVVRIQDPLGGGERMARRMLLDPSGVSLIVRHDLKDLYAPIRGVLTPALLVLFVIVALGGGVLALQVRPLAHRLQESEAQARASHDEISRIVAERTAELKTTNEALRQKQDELREVAAHQERLMEEERKRIAREVHDELGGQLTAIRSYVATVAQRRQARGEPRDPLLGDALDMLDSSVMTVRRVITELRPSVLDQLGLWAALEWMAAQFEERTGIPCALELDPALQDLVLDAQPGTAVFRIAQEALTNVERHSLASSVVLSAELVGGSVRVRVIDDGLGIGLPEERRPGSWGLVGMKERAEYFGGTLNVAGEKGRGTTVELIMPVRKDNVRAIENTSDTD